MAHLKFQKHEEIIEVYGRSDADAIVCSLHRKTGGSYQR